MKAIIAKYIGPTNSRGARVVATDGDHRVTVPFDSDASYRVAAVKLCKTKWRTSDKTCDNLIGGGTKIGRVFTQLPASCKGSGGQLDGARGRTRRR